MWAWGLALTLPVMILCGGLTGYFISILLVKQLGLPKFLTPALTGLGLLVAGLHAYTLAQRLNTNNHKEK